jgi:allantoin racemase
MASESDMPELPPLRIQTTTRQNSAGGSVMNSKRILYVQPSATDRFNKMVQDSVDRYASPGYEVVVKEIEYGGELPNSNYHVSVSIPYIVEEILKGERDGSSAAIVGCFGDPGIDEAREVVRIPVVGIGAAACHIACLLGDSISIVTTGAPIQHKKMKLSEKCHHEFYLSIKRNVQAQGLQGRIVSIRTHRSAAGGTDASARRGPTDFEGLLDQGRKAIQEDGADVIVLGCAFMVGIADTLQDELGVPVVDSTLAAVRVAEMLISMNLTQSALAYPFKNVDADKSKIVYPPTLKGYHGYQI